MKTKKELFNEAFPRIKDNIPLHTQDLMFLAFSRGFDARLEAETAELRAELEKWKRLAAGKAI